MVNPTDDVELEKFVDWLVAQRQFPGIGALDLEELKTIFEIGVFAKSGQCDGLAVQQLCKIVERDHSKILSAPRNDELSPAVVVAAEFGYKCCEKGMNIQAMLQKLFDL